MLLSDKIFVLRLVFRLNIHRIIFAHILLYEFFRFDFNRIGDLQCMYRVAAIFQFLLHHILRELKYIQENENRCNTSDLNCYLFGQMLKIIITGNSANFAIVSAIWSQMMYNDTGDIGPEFVFDTFGVFAVQIGRCCIDNFLPLLNLKPEK